jgi:hypothetical protein
VARLGGHHYCKPPTAGITIAKEAPEFADMKVAELKAELLQRGLSTAGLKKDLIKRLEQV